ncbi:MAG: Ig-like domain-containing protein [Calditrichaeota bacterium]|nr:Ig-like domain-containing protein [Calditrichota bacterium]
MNTRGFKTLMTSKSFFAVLTIFMLFQSGWISSAEAQTAARLQVLLPGMTAAPGTSSGYTGTPYTQTVGVPFQITVNATDNNWNVVGVSHLVSLSATDPFANLPSNTFLNNGTATMTVTINSQGSHTLTATDLSDPGVLAGTSPSFDVAEVLYFTITDIGEPWWILPGEVRVGDDIPQVEIIARDAQGNRVTNYNKMVTLSEQTDYGPGRIEPATIQITGGKWKGTIRIFRAGLKTRGWGVTGDVWVQVNDANISGSSNRFCANPRSYSKLLTLVPGETFVPGSITGKSGLPTDQQASIQFPVRIYTTDEYWNQRDIDTRIVFSSSDPAASLPPRTQLRDGYLSVSVTLNTPGLQTVTARDYDNSNIAVGVSSQIRVISYELHHFEISTIASPRTAGQPFQITITAVNSVGNPIPTYSGDVELTASTGLETISPQQVTLNNGAWTGQVTLTRAAQFVTISVNDLTQPPHTGTSNQFTVQPGPLTKLQTLLPGETATPGIAPGKTGTVSPILAGTAMTVRVNAVDAWWNLISSITHEVQFSSSDASASLPPNASLYNGTRQFSVTLNGTGVHTVTAHDVTQPSVQPGTSSQILVNPGNLYQFSFNNIVGPVTAGVPFSVSITAEDEYGNRLADYSGNLTLSASTGQGTISPTNIVMNQGLFTGNVTLTKAESGVSLSVSDAASPPHTGTSNQFRVNPGTLTKFQVIVPGIVATPGLSPGYSGSPNDQLAGQPFPIQINGVDANWNVVTSAQDSFGVSSTDLSASLPGNTVLVNGSKNLSITLNSGGAHTVSAFHLNNQQVANGQSPPINVIPQNLDHFAFEQIQGPVTAGDAFTVTIRAETNQNQVVGNFTGSVSLTASTGENTISPAVAGPFVGGEWTGSVTVTRAASNVTISASDDASPPHTGISNLFNVNPGPFNRLQVLLPGEDPMPGVVPGKTGQPLDQFTGVQFDFRVRAVDAHWNLITQATDSIELNSSDTLALMPDKSKLINGSATISAIMGTVGTHTISSSDITNTSITGGISSPFVVNPGNLDHFEFQAISDQTAGNEFQVQIFAADITGNPLPGFNGHARLESTTGEGTISPTQIEFVDGYWNGRITITRAASNVKISCLDFAADPHSGESNFFNVAPGQFTKLQILLQGEQGTPGIAPGKTGSVSTQLAGDAVAVTVNAVDNWWNPVPSASGVIGLTSTDPSANIPLDEALSSGTITFTAFRFMTPGNWTITANCKTNPDISSDTSPLVHVITGSVATFMFDPISSPQYAGDTLLISVNAVDGSGNTVSSYNEMASMTASTGPGTILINDIQFTDGQWTGPVVLTKAVQSIHLNIHDFDDIVRGNSNPFTLLPGALARVKILLPGETLTPGLATAKTGFPSPQTLGITFQATVYATDAWFNPVTPDSLDLHFSSTDPEAVLPPDTTQTVSSQGYDVTLLTTGKNRLAVETTGMPAMSDSSSEFTVLTGQIDHFIFTTIADSQVAGNPFTVRIEAHNQYNFPLLDYEGEVILSASTGNGTLSQTGVTLSGGSWEGEISITKADTAVVFYAADYIPAPNTHTGYSNQFSVLPEELAGLQVLLPGEVATPGVTPGKKENPDVQTAGESFLLQVRAVDPYWNLIVLQNDTLAIEVSDTFAAYADTVQLVDGEVQIPVTLRAAGKHCFTSTFMNKATLPAASSDSVEVNHNNFTQLLVLLPGESVLPGDTENDPLKTPGRQNQATRQTSGLSFPVEVYAVDDYWNVVPTAPNDQIRLFTTDNTAQVEPVNNSLLDGQTTFAVTLTQGGNQIIRAIDESNTNIRTSLDGQVEVLVGGLHYEIILDTGRVAAGEPFQMSVSFKNGNEEVVISANHLINFSLVDAANLTAVEGSLQYQSVNLANGRRSLEQSTNAVGLVRIKVEDEIGTAAAYSEPLEILAGSVASIEIQAEKNEVRALEKLMLSVLLSDGAGNPVPDQTVSFSVTSGTGTMAAPEGISNSEGIVLIEFTGGKLTESNIIRAEIDSVYQEFEVIVNLTPSSMPDGVPINYPNPFGGEIRETHIDYYLADPAEVTLRIYDLFGNLVWSKEFPAGSPGGMGRAQSSHPNSVIWDGTNNKGQKVGNGGYILMAKAVANGRVIMDTHRKIAIVR